MLFSQLTVFFPRCFCQRLEQVHSPRNTGVLVEETNLEQVLFPGHSIIQMNNSIYEAKIPTCQFAKDIYDRHHFPRKQTSKYHKGTPQYPRKIGKSLQKYLVLKECSEIVTQLKSRTPQYLRQRYMLLTEHLNLPMWLRFQQ